MSSPEVKIRIVVDDGQLKVKVGKVKTDLGGIGKAASAAGREAAAGLDQIKDKVTQLQEGLETVGKYAGLYLGFQAIKAGISNLVQAQLALQEIQYGLQAATGSAAAGAREFQYLSDTAERVGVRLIESGRAYAGYLAAAKAANLTTAESRDLFTATAEAGAVFNLSTGRMEQALLALQQMMGQGAIKSQELRQQLGQALPGAYSKFKALVESEGIDFEKALSEGDLDVKTFAPKLSQAIRSLYNDEALAGAANDLNSQLAKMENAIVRFKSSFTQGDFTVALSKLLSGVSGFVNGMAKVNSSIGPQVLIFGALTGGVIALTRALNSGVSSAVSMAQNVANLTGIGKTGAAVNVIRTNALLEEARAHQVNTAATLAEAEASLALASTQQRLIALDVTITEAKLAAARAKGVSAVASGELAAAETALAAAQARQARMSELQAVAAANVTIAKQNAAKASIGMATAETAATAATARMTGAMGLARGATAALSVAGRGLLSLLGGWPGVVIAAAGALIYFATRASEAEKATDSFIESLSAARGKMVEFMGQQKELNALTASLREAQKRGDTAEVARLTGLIDARGRELAQGREGVKVEQQRAAAKAEVARRDLAAAQADLKNKQANALPFVERSSAYAEQQRAIAAATDKVLQAQRAFAEAKKLSDTLEQQYKSSAGAAATVEAKDRLDQARAAAAEAKREADSAIKGLRQKEEEARDPSAILRNRVSNAIAEAKKKVPNFDALPLEEQKRLVDSVTASTTELVRAEQAADAAKKSSGGSSRGLSSALREQQQVAEEQKRALEAVSSSVATLNDVTRQNTDALREADPIRDQMEESFRGIDREVKQASQEIAESKLTDVQKAEALQSIAAAADKARAAVTGLADAERNRALQTAIKESKAASDSDAFRIQQDALSSSRAPGARDQYQVNEINRYFQGRVDEEAARFGNNLGSPEAQSAIERVKQNWSLALSQMVTESQAKGQQIEDALASSFTSTIMQMLNGGMTLQEGLTQIFMSIFNVFMENMVVRPLAELAARFIRERILHQAMLTAETTQQATASASIMATKQAESSANIAANAGTAASGAAASQASVPYVGPVLAIAAMIAIFAAVMALQKKSQKKASGGSIRGPGTGTSDSIPIMASNGEYMIKADSVRKYGVGFLDSVNNGTLGVSSPMGKMKTPRTRYAQGGPIMPSPAPPKEGSRVSGAVRVVNVIDPRLFEDYVNSPEGEKSILNVIEKNPRRVSQAVQGG